MKETAKEISFDDYTDSYKSTIQGSIDFIGQDVDFFIEIKARLLLSLAEKYVGNTKDINAIDIGSGIGLVDRYVAPHLGSVTGVDVEEGVIEKANSNNAGISYKLYDGKHLPSDDDSFDIAFAFNVMHHVPVDLWQNFVNEMKRVVRKGGLAVVFEHNPANPLTRRVVRLCEFDRDAVLLSHKKLKGLFLKSGLKTEDDAYIIFFPFKRKLFRSVERFIKYLPLGAQHYVAALK
jgi:SAM-dependent methyltransferase